MENAKFHLIKAPNEAFLLKGIQNSEWCVNKKAMDKLKENVTNNLNVIIFVSISGTDTF